MKPGIPKSSRWPLVLALTVSASCAETLPGEPPPLDILHFPLGLAFVPGAAPAQDRLIVANTNLDQRYNAGSLVALSVDELFAKARPFIGTTGVIEDVPVASALKVLNFGARVLSVPDGAGGGRVFMPSRGRNRLTMVAVDGGNLSCSTDGIEPLRAIDCTQAFVVHTGALDPFSIVHIPGESTEGLLAVAHLRPAVQRAEGGSSVLGTITLVDLETFDDRVELEQSNVGKPEAQRAEYASPVVAVQLSQVPGISGMVVTSSLTGGGVEHGLYVAGRDSAAGAALVLSDYRVTRPDARFGLTERKRISLGREARATETRGLTYDAARQRLYVSLRFFEPGDGSNAGIAVIDLTGSQMRIISLVEAGEELGAPVLRAHGDGANKRQLLYVPDIRTDEIFVIDVTADVATVVGQIGGRSAASSPVGRREMLDAPAEIVFIERQETLGFVSNFGNATLAVLDVSDPNPAKHRVFARFGTVLRSNGLKEGEE